MMLVKDQVKKERGYIGILYGSYMKTVDGEIKLIEFNCRFGDPEVLNILTNMKTSLLDIFVDIKDRNLGEWPTRRKRNRI